MLVREENQEVKASEDVSRFISVSPIRTPSTLSPGLFQVVVIVVMEAVNDCQEECGLIAYKTGLLMM